MDRRAFMRASAAGVTTILLASSSQKKAGASQPAGPRAIFLVTIDTLRADHMGSFGYFRDTTPFLDRLAAQGALFTNCFSATSSTLPAHATILTGLQLPQHKVLSNYHGAMDPQIRTLPECLLEAGYDTAGFVSTSYLNVLERGFEHFDEHQRQSEESYRSAVNTVDSAVDWLEARDPNDRFFLWIHLFDPHLPYGPPAEFLDAMQLPTDKAKRDALVYWTRDQHKRYECPPWRGAYEPFIEDHNRYDAEIAYVDHELKRLYTCAADKALIRDSLWVITADHGEGLGNHDLQGHSKHIYHEQLHVPLIILRTNEPAGGRRIDALVHHVDLFPTLLQLVEQRAPKQPVPIEGRSLVPLIGGGASWTQKGLAYSQRRSKPQRAGRPHRAEHPVYAVYDTESKYIVTGNEEDELYDLRNDPLELSNLARRSLESRDRLHRIATTRFQHLTESAEAIAEPSANDAHDETLKALGYL